MILASQSTFRFSLKGIQYMNFIICSLEAFVLQIKNAFVTLFSLDFSVQSFKLAYAGNYVDSLTGDVFN
jgi:hypothetical protein